MRAVLRNRLFVIPIAMLIFSSCGEKKKEILPASEGIPGEVMVVCNEAELENNRILFLRGFDEVTEKQLVIAEKAEAGKKETRYIYNFVRSQAYKGTEKQASFLILFEHEKDCGDFSNDVEDLKPDNTFETAFQSKGDLKDMVTISFYRNVWAQPQTVVRIHCRKKLDAGEMQRLAETLVPDMYEYEVSQGLPGNLAPNKYCDSVNKLIIGSYGFGLKFPPQFRLEMANKEVVWMRQDATKFYRDIFINIFSDSTKIETMEQAVANRNAFSKKYLLNEEGTRVLVSRSTMFPTQWEKDVKVGNLKAHVLRGWYEEELLARRGPFVRYFFHDEANHRYVAVDGFVFAPDMARLPFYRGFDIIAHSFAFEK